jgi:hypothetical protein
MTTLLLTALGIGAPLALDGLRGRIPACERSFA